MPKLSKDQAGFSAIEVVLIAVIIIIVAGVGWYVFHATENSNSTYNAATENSNNVSPKFKSSKATTTTAPSSATSSTTTDSSANKQD